MLKPLNYSSGSHDKLISLFIFLSRLIKFSTDFLTIIFQFFCEFQTISRCIIQIASSRGQGKRVGERRIALIGFPDPQRAERTAPPGHLLHTRNRKTLSRIKSTYGTRADRFIFGEEKIQYRHGALSAKNVEKAKRGGRLFSILQGLFSIVFLLILKEKRQVLDKKGKKPDRVSSEFFLHMAQALGTCCFILILFTIE